MSDAFALTSDFKPAGDQPAAIAELIKNLRAGATDQVLLGVTGSGKTFTMAHVIATLNRPTLILAPNKTLAAQLYQEMKSFFPNNAVEYFVSYYDYYQPEAYVPRSDTYIEKEATINEQIDRLRHAATRALFERRDVIIVASVSCIYGIGSKEDYQAMTFWVNTNMRLNRQDFIAKLIELQYIRNDIAFARGHFRVRGDVVELFPAHMEDRAWRFSFFGDDIDGITEFDPLTAHKYSDIDGVRIYANSHYVTPGPTIQEAIKNIKAELKIRLDQLRAENKLVEAQRLEQRTTFDVEMLAATGMCQGIENYSRFLTGRPPGSPPPTLIEYLPADGLMILDESHVMIPQLNGMYAGDRSRKITLSEYGFRLPSCMDNRPLKFEEWDNIRPQTIFVSATPGPWELAQTNGVFVEQIVRPTGLIDPPVDIRKTEGQIDDLMHTCRDVVARGGRALVTTLTKKMAEGLTDYLAEHGLKVQYLHSDIDTLDRIDILRDLRLGVFDILVGINLLREGLDIPECMLVAILDADKEGFLRNKTSLIQTIGRAARNVEGRAVLYADKITKSMQAAMDETARRRQKQIDYNTAHNITPESVKKDIAAVMNSVYERADHVNASGLADPGDQAARLKQIEVLAAQMNRAAADLEFETAAKLRDEIKRLEAIDLGLSPPTFADQIQRAAAAAKSKRRK